MADFLLNQGEYEALVALARRGTTNANALTDLERFLKNIEEKNGLIRDFVLVQWQERSAALPVSTKFPDVWPPELREPIELVTRKIARADVDAMLENKANDPIEVLVTRDPAGLVGWTPVDGFFK